MYLTNVLMKAPKSKIVMVLLRSTGSSHKVTSFRERNEDKKELIMFDPFIQMECVYKEEKKIRSMKRALNLNKNYNEDTYGIIPEELLPYDVSSKKPSSKHKNKIASIHENN